MIDLAGWFPRANSQVAPDAVGTFALASVIKILVVFGLYLVGVAFLTLAERKLAAWFQDRRGPNRAGPGGILQPVADGLKNFMKEETNPASADKWLFLIAPAFHTGLHRKPDRIEPRACFRLRPKCGFVR